MEKVFKFLTKQDIALLLDRADRVSYAKNQIILEEGSRRRVLFVIRKGLVRVELSHRGQGIAITRLGEGDIFGEMSFIEEDSVTASIVAEEEVEVAVIEGAAIHSLLASIPGLSSRFYQSLAFELSQRLRNTTRRLPALMVEEVAQVKRFHGQRTGHINFDQIPPKLMEDAEDFKTAMLTIDSAIKTRKITPEEVQEQVNQACDAIHDSLRYYIKQEKNLEAGIGAYVFRETFPFFMLSSLFDRSYTKPRGYADDYETCDMIYRNNPTGDGRLGPYIDAWLLSIPAFRAVRNRLGLLTQLIKEAAEKWDRPMPITNLASGSAREVFNLFTGREKLDLFLTCVDIDNKALEYTANIARDIGITNQMSFVQENVMRLARGRSKTVFQPQEIIYSIGLIDYLQEDDIVSLMDWIFHHLLPGGRIILGNYDVSNPNKEFMTHILEWVIIHRSQENLRNLFAKSKFGSRPVKIITEDTGVQLFAICTKD